MRQRLIASSTHLVLSLILFIIILLTLTLFWYPTPYFTAAGGLHGLKIVAFIDIVLGPLLTFAVYNPQKQKKTLITDLAIILTLQITAMGWGIYTIYQERPFATVFWEHSFYSVPYKAFSKEERQQLKQIDKVIPAMVIAKKPKSVKDLETLLQKTTSGQKNPLEMVELYQPYLDGLDEIFESNLDINEITSINNNMQQQLEKLLHEQKLTRDQVFFIPLQAKSHNIIFIFHVTGDLLGYLSAPTRE